MKLEVKNIKDEYTLFLNGVALGEVKGPCSAAILGAYIKALKDGKMEGLVGFTFDHIED